MKDSKDLTWRLHDFKRVKAQRMADKLLMYTYLILWVNLTLTPFFNKAGTKKDGKIKCMV